MQYMVAWPLKKMVTTFLGCKQIHWRDQDGRKCGEYVIIAQSLMRDHLIYWKVY